jgi:hypothetical protein
MHHRPVESRAKTDGPTDQIDWVTAKRCFMLSVFRMKRVAVGLSDHQDAIISPPLSISW